MAYDLTLTPAERQAIDFAGNRYRMGDELFRLLMQAKFMPNDAEWDTFVAITFDMPEHVAWEIRDICDDENYGQALFNAELVAKFMEFCNKIV